MARFFGQVGYELPGELVDGVWSVNMTERALYGDVTVATRATEPTDKVNDDVRVRNQISLIADAFAMENFSWIKYVSWNGVRWAVETVTVERPRLSLTLGGVWDGQVAPDPTPTEP